MNILRRYAAGELPRGRAMKQLGLSYTQLLRLLGRMSLDEPSSGPIDDRA